MVFQIGNKVMLGRKLSVKTRRLLSKIRKGKKAWNKGVRMPGHNAKNAIKYGVKTRWKSGDNAGKKHYGWKGGQNLSYWKRAVKRRDKKCMKCGELDPRVLTADHVKSKKMYPKLQFDIKNGMTLCFNCHAIKTLEDKEYRQWMHNNHWKKNYGK